MSITKIKLIELLKETEYPVYRDSAPVRENYPYIVYSMMYQSHKRASGLIYKALPRLQISLFTTGIETDFNPIIKKLDSEKIPFSYIESIQGDENDETVTNFYTSVGCVEDVK